MESIIIKDFIKEDDLKDCLYVFFKGQSVSIAYFNLENGIQDEDILFEYVLMHGDFKFELCLYTSIVFSIDQLSLSTCKRFKTQVLISDSDINPYSWILINETGKVGMVEQIVRGDDFFQIQAQ